MKRRIGNSGSSSSTNCFYRSQSKLPCVQHFIETGSKVDKLYYGKYLPLHERKLLEKLIRTRAVYEKVWTELLSASESSDPARDSQDDSTERNSACTKLVDLVDRGEIRSSGTSKLNSCGSCCSSSSRLKEVSGDKYPRVYRHSEPYEAIEKYTLEANRKGRARHNKLSFKVSSKLRVVPVKAKRVKSEPCACALGISSKVKRKSKGHLKKCPSKEMSTITTDTLKNTVKTESRDIKLAKCDCNLQHSKPLGKSMHKIKCSKISSKAGESEGTTRIEFQIQKDSLTLFRDKLKNKTALKDWECGPEDCYKNIKTRNVVRKRKNKKCINKSSSTDLSQIHVSISTKKKVSNVNVGKRVKKNNTKCMHPLKSSQSRTTSVTTGELTFQKGESTVIKENVRLRIERKKPYRKTTSHCKQSKKQRKVQADVLCDCTPTQISIKGSQSASQTSKSTSDKSMQIQKKSLNARKQHKKQIKVQTAAPCDCPPTKIILEENQLKLPVSLILKPACDKSIIIQKTSHARKQQTKKKQSEIQTTVFCGDPSTTISLEGSQLNQSACLTSKSNYSSAKKKSKSEICEKLESHPNRQAITRGSTMSLNIELHNKVSPHNNGSDDYKYGTKTEDLYKSSPNMTKENRRIKNKHRSSQSISFRSNKNSQVGHGLKRCICTLKIPKRKQKPCRSSSKKTLTTLKVQNVDVIGQPRESQTKAFKYQDARVAYVTPPLTSKSRALHSCKCEPLFITPRECDPCKGENKIRVNCNSSKKICKENNTLQRPKRCAGTLASDCMCSSSRKIQTCSPKHRKGKHYPGIENSQISINRSICQGRKGSSSILLNIEFSKGKISCEPEVNEMQKTIQEQPLIGRKHCRQKGIKVHKPCVRHITSQTMKTDKSKQTHTKKGGHKSICPANILKEQSTNVLLEYHQESSVLKRHKSIATKKENMTHSHSQATAECNAYKCDKLIKKRSLKSENRSAHACIGPITKSKLSTTCNGRNSHSAAKRMKYNARKTNEASRNEGDLIKKPSQPGKQAVRSGSSISLKVEFCKEHGNRSNDRPCIRRKTSETCSHHVSCAEKKGSAFSSAIKRCFNSLKFHKKRPKIYEEINIPKCEHMEHRKTCKREGTPKCEISPKIILKPNYCRSGVDGNYECCKETKHSPVELKEKHDIEVKPKIAKKVKKEHKSFNIVLKLKKAMKIQMIEKNKNSNLCTECSQSVMVKVKKPKAGEFTMTTSTSQCPVIAAYCQVTRNKNYKAMKPNLSHKYDQYASENLNIMRTKEENQRDLTNHIQEINFTKSIHSRNQFHEVYSPTELFSNSFEKNYPSYRISQVKKNFKVARIHRDIFPDYYSRNRLSKQCIRYDSSISFDVKSRIDTLKIKSSALYQIRDNKNKNFNDTQAMKSPFQRSFYAFNVQLPNSQAHNNTLDKFGQCDPIKCLKRINNSRPKSKNSSDTNCLSVISSTESKFSTKCKTAQSNFCPATTPKQISAIGRSAICEYPISNKIRDSSRHSLHIGSNCSLKVEFYKQKKQVEDRLPHKPGANSQIKQSTTGVHNMKKLCQSSTSQNTVNSKNKGIGAMLKRFFSTLKLHKMAKTAHEVKKPNKQKTYKQATADERFVSVPGEPWNVTNDPNACYKLIQKRYKKGREQSVGADSAKMKSGHTKFDKKHETKNTPSIAHKIILRKGIKNADKRGHQNDNVSTNRSQGVGFGPDIAAEFYKERPSGDFTSVGKGGFVAKVKSMTRKEKSKSTNQDNITSLKTQDAKSGTSILEKCFFTWKLKKKEPKLEDDSKGLTKGHSITFEKHKYKRRISLANVKCYENAWPYNKVSEINGRSNECDENTFLDKNIKNRRKRSKNTKEHRDKYDMWTKSDTPKEGTTKAGKRLTRSFECTLSTCNSDHSDPNKHYKKHKTQSWKGVSQKTQKNDNRLAIVDKKSANKSRLSLRQRYVCAIAHKFEYDCNCLHTKHNRGKPCLFRLKTKRGKENRDPTTQRKKQLTINETNNIDINIESTNATKQKKGRTKGKQIKPSKNKHINEETIRTSTNETNNMDVYYGSTNTTKQKKGRTKVKQIKPSKNKQVNEATIRSSTNETNNMDIYYGSTNAPKQKKGRTKVKQIKPSKNQQMNEETIRSSTNETNDMDVYYGSTNATKQKKGRTKVKQIKPSKNKQINEETIRSSTNETNDMDVYYGSTNATKQKKGRTKVKQIKPSKNKQINEETIRSSTNEINNMDINYGSTNATKQKKGRTKVKQIKPSKNKQINEETIRSSTNEINNMDINYDSTNATKQKKGRTKVKQIKPSKNKQINEETIRSSTNEINNMDINYDSTNATKQKKGRRKVKQIKPSKNKQINEETIRSSTNEINNMDINYDSTNATKQKKGRTKGKQIKPSKNKHINEETIRSSTNEINNMDINYDSTNAPKQKKGRTKVKQIKPSKNKHINEETIRSSTNEINNMDINYDSTNATKQKKGRTKVKQIKPSKNKHINEETIRSSTNEINNMDINYDSTNATKQKKGRTKVKQIQPSKNKQMNEETIRTSADETNNMYINHESTDATKQKQGRTTVKQINPQKKHAELVKTKNNGYSFVVHGNTCLCEPPKPYGNTSTKCLCRGNEKQVARRKRNLLQSCSRCFIRRCKKPAEEPFLEMVVNAGDMSIMNKDKIVDKLKESRGPRKPMASSFSIAIDNRDASILNRYELRNKIKENAKPNRTPCGKCKHTRGPCICGSARCKMVSEQDKDKEMDRKPVMPCVCGAKICKEESKKSMRERPGTNTYLRATKQVLRGKISFKHFVSNVRHARMVQTKGANFETERQREKAEAARQKKKIKMNKAATKEFAKSTDCALLTESIFEMSKLSCTAASGMARTVCKAIIHPKTSMENIKDIANDPHPCKIVTRKIADSEFGNKVNRIKLRLGAMSSTKKCLTCLHIGDKEKRLKRKLPNLETFRCNAFVASLRRKPHFWVYEMCPWFYPYCLGIVGAWRQFTDLLLFLLAIVVWSPCILIMEACRSLMCCFLCTG